MISKGLQLVFFWRRNHLPSIAFKSALWGLIAWLAVGMFTDVRLALIAAAVIATMSAVKYGLQSRKQTKKLMAMCDGDPQKFAALQAKLNAPGMAGTLMREMLNAELDDDDDDDEDDVEPLTYEQRQANISANIQLISRMAALTHNSKLGSDEHFAQEEEEMLEEYNTGDERLEVEEVISRFLPDNILHVVTEDFIDEDDHATLVVEFSQATNGRWVIEDCTSKYDEDSERWVVTFKENGKEKTWRFAQDSDYLSENFLQQLMKYTESKSSYTITVLDMEEIVSLACLPSGMYETLTNENTADKAA